MLTIALLLLLSAFVVTIAASLGKAPIWIAVLLLVIVGLLQSLPIR
jgi:hypothetical protein